MVNIKEIFSENKGVFVIAIFTAVVISMVSANPIPAYADATPFIGDIMYTGYNFAPRNWSFCDGQLLPISPNAALFALLGTQYGGDGRTTFGIPDMRGRSPIGDGQGPGLPSYSIGQRGGSETIILSVANLAPHSHQLDSGLKVQLNGTSSTADQTSALGNSFGTSFARIYSTASPTIALHSDTLSVSSEGMLLANTGSSASHNNSPPSLTLSCNIALLGTFPSRN